MTSRNARKKSLRVVKASRVPEAAPTARKAAKAPEPAPRRSATITGLNGHYAAMGVPTWDMHLGEIRSAAVTYDWAHASYRDAVVRARMDGVTWSAIARALGVTRQTVAQRWGKYLPDDAR